MGMFDGCSSYNLNELFELKPETKKSLKQEKLPPIFATKVIIARNCGMFSTWYCDGHKCADDNAQEWEVLQNLPKDGWRLISVIGFDLPLRGKEIHYYLEKQEG